MGYKGITSGTRWTVTRSSETGLWAWSTSNGFSGEEHSSAAAIDAAQEQSNMPTSRMNLVRALHS